MENTFDNNYLKELSNKNDFEISNKMLTVVLVALIIFSLLGINILNMVGNVLQYIVNIFSPLITQILSLIGYTIGSIINTIASLFTVTAKTGVDIAGGTLTSVGDLMKDASSGNLPSTDLNQSNNIRINIPSYDDSNGVIQTPSTSKKSQWCLVGEYEGRRGCVEISEGDKCLSGDLYPNAESCMNPTITSNSHPLKPKKE
jgi:hypothetical protein